MATGLYRGSRWQMRLVIVVVVAVVIGPSVRHPKDGLLLGLILLLLLGPMLYLSERQAVFASSEALTYRSFFRRRRYPWSEIDRFQMGIVSGRGGGPVVTMVLSDKVVKLLPTMRFHKRQVQRICDELNDDLHRASRGPSGRWDGT